MKLGMIGLGRMGGNMVERLIRGGHQVVVYDSDESSVAALTKNGALGARSLSDIISQLVRKNYMGDGSRWRNYGEHFKQPNRNSRQRRHTD